jgi:hypothetical protein
MVTSAVAFQPSLPHPGPRAAKDDPELDVPVLVPSLDSEIALDRLPHPLSAPATPVVDEPTKEVGKVLEA